MFPFKSGILAAITARFQNIAVSMPDFERLMKDVHSNEDDYEPKKHIIYQKCFLRLNPNLDAKRRNDIIQGIK